jgi:hypothetical protein
MLTAFFVSSEIKFRTSPSGSEVGRVGKALLRLMLAAVDGLSDEPLAEIRVRLSTQPAIAF